MPLSSNSDESRKGRTCFSASQMISLQVDTLWSFRIVTQLFLENAFSTITAESTENYSS